MMTRILLSFWLMFWSLGVAVISWMAVKGNAFIWLFVFTHGVAEIGVGWMLTRAFVRAMERTIGGPTVTLDVAGLTARWRSQRRSVLILLWCAIQGLIVGAILAAGTWIPILLAGEPTRGLLLSSLLSVAWAGLGVLWLRALWEMVRMMGTVELTASPHTLSAVHRLGAVEVEHELPMAGLVG